MKFQKSGFRFHGANLRCATLLAALFALGSCASPDDSVRRSNEINEQAPIRVSERDAAFLVEMVDGRRMDYAEGKLAAERATTPAVRAYGAEMARDQPILLDELDALAASGNVTVPTAISESKSSALHDLEALQGKDFDKRFVSMITIDHERDVGLCKKAGEADRDPAIRSFAQRRLPLIQQHLDEVNAIHESM